MARQGEPFDEIMIVNPCSQQGGTRMRFYPITPMTPTPVSGYVAQVPEQMGYYAEAPRDRWLRLRGAGDHGLLWRHAGDHRLRLRDPQKSHGVCGRPTARLHRRLQRRLLRGIPGGGLRL